MEGPIFRTENWRRPIILPVRKAVFTCEICGRQGYGALTAKVHSGACRAEKTRRSSAAAVARKRKRKTDGQQAPPLG